MINELNLKTVSTLVAVCALAFGIVKFVRVQEIEAAKPYLERKLAWCEEAVETASKIANSGNGSQADERRFLELYWGVMGMVEKDEITKAMIAFGEELESGEKLKSKALGIAHACRTELANDWSSSWAR
ncbi:MAG: hypothetical protein U5L98_05730 [Halomonas sp.]|uniref:hypothetical protein n=1 Tax=Halomonas sp. TaxID=1486246 RepID=UPI002ACE86CC|nr:hypothetical protein [Halomonas sp.]MDZ7852151.1 hypothetical protein [Halomonas sp.]